MGLKDMSTCAKGCIACGACSAIVAAIMIPVGWLVIAPNMAQNALNHAVMTIPNSTVHNLPDDLHHDHTAMIFNDVQLVQDTVPLYTKMHETDLVMNVPAFDAGWCAWNQTNLGWFTMPEQGIRHGENHFKFDKDLHVFEDTDNFVHWSLMLTLGGFPYGTVVRIVGAPRLTAMGMVNMDLKLGKSLNCSYQRPPDSVQADATLEEVQSMDFATKRRLSRGMGPVTLKCTPMRDNDGVPEMDDDDIDQVLDSFQADLDHKTTTTTTTTKAPAPPPPPPPPTTPAPQTTTTEPATPATNVTTTAPAVV